MISIFNAAQPGVGRVQVLGSKKFQTEEEEEEEQLLVFAWQTNMIRRYSGRQKPIGL